MGYPKRHDQFNTPAEAAGPRPLGPVLVEEDVIPKTASAPSLAPPPRVPPGVAATSLGPEPDPRPRCEPIPVNANSALQHWPAYITFQAGTFVSIVAVLFIIILVGILAGIGVVR
jgi:hypothetical protein